MFSFGKKSIVIILFLFFVIAILGWAWNKRDSLPYITKPVMFVLSPFESVFSTISTGVENFFGSIGSNFKKQEDLENLLNRIKTLESEEIKYNEIMLENKRLHELLNFKNKNYNYTLALANVISRDYGTWSNTLVIDKGVNDGLEKYMSIIVPDGVVGFVSDVYNNSARVQLILDPRTSVGGLVQRENSRVTSVVRGNGNNPMRPVMVNILKEADVLVGDLIVTSGLGQTYPKGLALGRVEEINIDMDGFVKEAIIVPSVDFSKLEEVFVVTKYDEVTINDDINETKLIQQTKRDQVEGAQGAVLEGSEEKQEGIE